MKHLILSLITLFTLNAFSQDTKTVLDPNATPRTLSGSFTAISVTDGIDLFLTQGTEEKVAVSAAEDKYLERFRTEVVDGVLKLYFDNKGINWALNINRKLKAYVSFKTLEKLSASGGASVKGDGVFTVTDLVMKFTSGSHFTGQVDAKSMDVDQNSGAGVSISGKAEKIKVECSSGALFKGYDLVVDYCDAKASSGGGVHITINKELSAKANSGGGIRYKGAALIRDVNISSGGIVKKEK